MADIWIAVVQGIVEGLTEFLPISSTGHLILSGHLLGFTGDKAETFEIVIQLGAILAVALLYWRRLLRLIGWEDPSYEKQSNKSLTLIHIFLAIVPAMLLGLLMHGLIKDYLFTPQTVLIGLVVGGFFMIFAERKHTIVIAKTMDELSYRQAFQIGIAQCLALWPGFSRSGATIAGGLLSGANLRTSADFSFLIAVPMMVAATSYDLMKNMGHLSMDDLSFFLVGFIVSFIVALLAVVSFLKLLEKVKLSSFAYYRFILAGVFWLYMVGIGLD
ncbi:undecaprenyl-diphosphate phosphatase [Chengkuizengella axinellae]|uniref:Undecaprenyl-diphosphatase n=1 Tax=Chengkuizengella axinellae TaxID=3064388 RepID=A0ABT9J0E0_9BACL|nr:undecaprenyl-diphosphate phosphatase [Chengkuizengella sp. 2205SS18-9]MDP5275078.1 undecaprenyl-diphosphate phosphatase [Chengkuizengella sp. 2205SS18-9]